MATNCIFCQKKTLIKEHVLYAFDHWFGVLDGFPVSKGHVLIIPKRHIMTIFELDVNEWQELQEVIECGKMWLDQEYQPDGYNVGINNGEAAGQTVFHLHIHLIPRYKGDMEDPRGGVRWIMPDKAKYW